MVKQKAEVPSLQDLETKQLTIIELQTVVLHLIRLHNKSQKHIDQLIMSGQIRTPREALMKTPFDI